MILPLPIMRSLDPYHARIGYLGALSLIADRGADSREAVRSRLEDLLLIKVYVDSPEYEVLTKAMSADRRRGLDEVMAKRKPEDNPASILAPLEARNQWVYVSEVWLYQDCMPSPIGFVPPAKIDRTIDFARWCGVLTPSFEISDVGLVLKHLLQNAKAATLPPNSFNPLNAHASKSLTLLYLRLILAAEILWPALIAEFVERSETGRRIVTRGEECLLGVAADRFLRELGEPKDISDAVELRDISAFRDAVYAKPSTAENYLRPRLEILVDLDLLGKVATEDRRHQTIAWVPTEVTRRVAEEWRPLTIGGNHVADYLERRFFESMAGLLRQDHRRVTDSRRVLLWFGRAFQRIGSEIGFTPGRSLAVLACLLAFEQTEVIEVSQVFDAVYEAATSPWGEYLRYSGGSRMDREFLIKVDPGMVAALEQDLTP